MGGTNDENGDTNDENLENRPSTSKNKSGESGESCLQLFRSNKGGVASNSDLSASPTYSETSIQEMAYTSSKMSRPRRRTGRITKNKRRRTPSHRRRVWRPKIRSQRKASILSISAFSSREGSKICCCAYCGHTCCRTSFATEARIPRGVKKNRYVRRPKRVRKGRVTKIKRRSHNVKSHKSKQLQAGSRSVMLSPLFISTSAKPNLEIQVDEKKTYTEVTPEMIYESIRKLTTWRQNVATCDLLAHIQRSYPVNPDPNELNVELKEKLRIACIAGIVQEINDDLWWLKSSLENLTSNHVTLFWKTYSDTMSPIEKERG